VQISQLLNYTRPMSRCRQQTARDGDRTHAVRTIRMIETRSLDESAFIVRDVLHDTQTVLVRCVNSHRSVHSTLGFVTLQTLAYRLCFAFARNIRILRLGGKKDGTLTIYAAVSESLTIKALFLLTCRLSHVSVRPSVCPKSVVLWQNGRLDPKQEAQL